MDTRKYLEDLTQQLTHLYAFARQINEIDFAASLGGEFRGAQDQGWNTTITAHQVFDEISAYTTRHNARSPAELRIILMLYCQLAEAGGAYETLKNIMGVIKLKPYLLWPFHELVRVQHKRRRVIGPNANATFRDLATTANQVGLSGLSSLLENTFQDDIRNAIYHADYVLWDDGLRLRNRNGGNAKKIPYEDVSAALTRGISFFDLLKSYNTASVHSFDPPKEIVGRFSANQPMPWTVEYSPQRGSFRIYGSAPCPVITPEYKRQSEINGRLGGKVLAVFSTAQDRFKDALDTHISNAGFEPNDIAMDAQQFESLVAEINSLNLWDNRISHSDSAEVLLASPWGFRWIHTVSDFDQILQKPIIELTYTDRPDDEPQSADVG